MQHDNGYLVDVCMYVCVYMHTQLEKRVYSTESGDSITKIEMAIDCETQLEFKFQEKEVSAQVGNSRKRRTATDCAQVGAE